MRMLKPLSQLSRGKLMVGLALNKALGEKLKKLGSPKKQTSSFRQTDPDYQPIESESDSDNEESTINNASSSEVNAQLTETTAGASENSNRITKQGNIRKRKVSTSSLYERKVAKLELERRKHSIKVSCSHECKRKCSSNISREKQEQINNEFWNMSPKDRKWFIFKLTAKRTTMRKTSGPNSRRIFSYSYKLPCTNDDKGKTIEVCKIFFLATLGYDKTNDRVVRNVISKSNLYPAPDRRGKYERKSKMDRNVIEEHIESFKPVISHYRREHAPNRRYLPSDITIKDMYENFQKMTPRYKCSYEMYRKVVAAKNISFAQLGNEECYQCEQWKLHKHVDDLQANNCSTCQQYKSHNEKAKLARIEYQKDVERSCCEKGVEKQFFSGDLEKVIMLPRCEMFKEIMFTPRIIAFNESFAPLGGSKSGMKPVAMIWHEGIAGRTKEDIISTFNSFILEKRDAEEITIWLDNCASQNKNWALICFFVYIVNSMEVNLNCLHVKYFEPGHTFMAADVFHHTVEKSLKKMRKVYDFCDFKKCVQLANSSNVTVIDMELQQFFDWKDFTSQYKLSKINPRPYLNEMIHLMFTRGKHTMKYQCSFNEENFIELNFLTASIQKNGIQKPAVRSKMRGITLDRKTNLIQKLSPIIPPCRLPFWLDLPTCDVSLDVGNL